MRRRRAMQLGREQAVGFVEEDVAAAAVHDADLAADRAAADGSGAVPASGPEREHATAG
jgi:hypothetical protein